MSKAVLVMDMPETCNNCDFLYMAEGDLYDDFCVLNRINVPSIKKRKTLRLLPTKTTSGEAETHLCHTR